MLKPNGTKAYAYRVATWSQLAVSRPQRRLKTAAAPTASQGQHDKAEKDKTGWSPTAATVVPGGSQSVSPGQHRADHSRGIGESTKYQDYDEHGQVGALADPSLLVLAEPGSVVPQFAAGRPGQNADVVVRAGVDAVEAKRAIHVARLARLE